MTKQHHHAHYRCHPYQHRQNMCADTTRSKTSASQIFEACFFHTRALNLQQLFLHRQADVFNALDFSQFGQHHLISFGISYYQLVRVFDSGAAKAAILRRYKREIAAKAFKNGGHRGPGPNVACETEAQEAVMRLVCTETGEMQVYCYQTQKNGAHNGDGVALGAGRHTYDKRTEDKNYVPRVFYYVTEADNSQSTHQSKSSNDTLADDSHNHGYQNGYQNKRLYVGFRI